MLPTADDPFSGLLDKLDAAVKFADAEGFLSLWPDTAKDYAGKVFADVTGLKSTASSVSLDIRPVSSDCGIVRLSLAGNKHIDLGYCRLRGRPRLVWKYAVARKHATADWRVAHTKYYNVYLSPSLRGEVNPDLLT